MKLISIAAIALFITTLATAQDQTDIPQIAPNTFLVEFTDKNDNGFSLDKPEEFLSARAIERRQRYNISLTEQDLPVTKAYVDSLEALGFEIYAVSKWLNHAVVYTEDSTLLEKIPELSFVALNPTAEELEDNDKKENEKPEYVKIKIKKENETVFDYGSGETQIGMLNAHYLHNRGFQGQGMLIGILDAGFYKADELPAFDSAFANEQIVGYKDCVARDGEVFSDGSHGMMVLSTIAANMPGKLVGTAPKADYLLVRTEDGDSEYMVEEYYWITGAEFADSMGVDVINTSLGYTEYDDGNNHTYESLDGNTAPITIASNIAADKGILLVTSAGNEGADPWRHISAPADAHGVLTVGSVTSSGKLSSFSSRGPSADGRIKPDVMAQGSFAFVQGTGGNVTFSFGTSFSGPIMTGAITSLWQAFPEFTAEQIKQVVRLSAHQYDKPDNDYGYGIPDFSYAYEYLTMWREKNKSKDGNTLEIDR